MIQIGFAPNATYDLTSYFAVVGPQTAWRGSTPVKLSDLPDNGRRMILLVESADPRNQLEGTERPDI